MGAGGFQKKIDNILTSLLFSLTKIEPLRRYFYSNNFKGEICKALSYHIKNNCNDKIRINMELIQKKIREEDIDKDLIDAEWLFKYLLEEINKELKKENKSNEFLKELFYGSYEIIPRDVSEKKEKKYMPKPLIFSIDLTLLDMDKFRLDPKKNSEVICLNKIIKAKFEESLRKYYPEFLENNNIQMPEICIITLSNVKDTIQFYLSQEINIIPYELIYYMNYGEDNEGKINFFKENSFWYEYLNENNFIQDINDIKNIKDINPKILFYQKRNNLIEHFFSNKSLIMEEQNRIISLMNEHIIPENEYEKYYLVNPNKLNEILTALNDPKLSKENIYKKVRFIPKEENLLSIGEETNKDTNLMFPKNFVMLKEDVYKKFLENSDIDFIYEKKDSNDYKFKFKADLIEKKYKVKFGENLAFIKMEENNCFMEKEKKEQERIFVCSYNKNKEIFEVEIIMQYFRKGGFDEDLEKYISNRGGMEYFYRIKELDIKKPGFQEMNRNNEKIDKFVNIINVEKNMDMNRYEMLGSLNDFDSFKNINMNISSDVYQNPINIVAEEFNMKKY